MTLVKSTGDKKVNLDFNKEFINTFSAKIQSADIQTPPLPNTPMPMVRTAALPGVNTNLTRTQQALLSPEEQVIASRRT